MIQLANHFRFVEENSNPFVIRHIICLRSAGTKTFDGHRSFDDGVKGAVNDSSLALPESGLDTVAA
jgi:hypothetical protein